MQLTLDNLDGLGALDYTAALDLSEPFRIERTLNAPSTVRGLLCLAGSNLAVPVRRARLVATASSGTVLFTGYLATEPVALYAGVASQGPVYRYGVLAVSDEWLLDKQSAGATTGRSVGVDASTLLQSLTARLPVQSLATAGLPGTGNLLGYFEPKPGATWSSEAGAILNSSLNRYQAANGALSLAPVGSVVHALSDAQGTLSLAGLKTTAVRELSNDVTLIGEEEPHAYWTELFLGDGTTSVFNLLGEPLAPKAGQETVLLDLFDEPVLNHGLWQIHDPGSRLALGANGLTLAGGNGLDGGTTLSGWDPVELGGTIVFELGNVQLDAGSAGLLGGLYSGIPVQANCLAGFRIRQSGGQTVATPLVNGAEAGVSLPILPGHGYTLRLRLHCPETLRVGQSYYALLDTPGGGAAIQQFGGAVLAAPLSLVFEARDLAASSNTAATVLYDGSLAASPAQCTPVPVNSPALLGSIGAVRLERTGSGWVRSRSAAGTSWTRLEGKASEGADFLLEALPGASLTFFPGRVPAAGETVTVSYRGRRRAVARLADPGSVAAEAAAGGANGTARWLGHVVRPRARSSEDCESAAEAILSVSTNRAAAVAGSYTAANPPLAAGSDLWPGDVLAIASAGATINAIIRRVTLSTQGARPEAITYHVAFANSWAEDLALELSETVPAGTALPPLPLNLVVAAPGTPPALPVHTLASPANLTLAGPAAGALTVDAGMAAPPGGGFEVRRHDGGFGVGLLSAAGNGDLVLRSPVRSFSLPVAAAGEIFFVRMYDSASPPLYSRRSAAIVVHGAGG